MLCSDSSSGQVRPAHHENIVNIGSRNVVENMPKNMFQMLEDIYLLSSFVFVHDLCPASLGEGEQEGRGCYGFSLCGCAGCSKNTNTAGAVVAHSFSPSTREAEAGGSL